MLFMPFAILGILVPGAARPGAPRGRALAPRQLVRRAAASDPGAPDGPQRHAPPGPAAVLPRAGDPLASWPHLGDSRLGGRSPAGAGASGGGPPLSPLRWRAGRRRLSPRSRATVEHLPGPYGTTLHFEIHGPPEAPPLLVTHGWGVTSAQWYYLLQDVGERFRLVVWDLPGLGRSTRPAQSEYSLDMMARALDAILTFLGYALSSSWGTALGG